MQSRYLPFLLLAVMAVPLQAADSSALEKQYKDQIERLLPGMAASEIPAREQPQQALEKLCHQAGAPGKEAEREALSKAIMAFVVPETPKPAHVWLLRKIEPLGRAEVVEPLKKLIGDEDREIADLALRALANNPSEQAAAALRAELSETPKPALKAALMNALAFRRDAASVEMFAKLAGKPKPLVATAAISALGEVGNEAAAEALAELRKSAPAELKPAVADASLRAADRLLADNKVDAAKAIYTELLAAEQPEHLRIAGLTGLARIPGDDRVATLLKYATGDDAHLRLIAARCLSQLPADRDTSRQLAITLRSAAPEVKPLLVEVLGDRGDPHSLPSVMQFMESQDDDLRLAAYEAIGKLGDAGTARVLVIQAAKAKGQDREIIRKSLASLRRPGVDETILKELRNARGAARIELIMAVWGRRISAAKPILLEWANDPDEDTRTAVLTALERLGNEADLPRVIEMMVAAQSDEGVKAAQQAIASICRRAGNAEKAAPPLIEAMDKASPAARVAIIQQLGKIQGPAALGAVRAALKSEDAKVKEAAVAALAEWKPMPITNWVVSGPFKREGKSGTELFDIAFAPESNGEVQWKPLKGAKNEGRFNLAQVAKGDNLCVYVKTVIQSGRKQDVVFDFGSDDGIKVWLNGQVVHGNNATRGLNCYQDRAKATLNEGANTLLLKVTQVAGDFGFCASIKAADGGPVEGVTFEAR